MATSESKGRFFTKRNRFESIRITNRIDSNRDLECSSSRWKIREWPVVKDERRGLHMWVRHNSEHCKNA